MADNPLLPARFSAMWYALGLAWAVLIQDYFSLNLSPVIVFGVPVTVMLATNIVNYFWPDELETDIKREYLTEAMSWGFIVMLIVLPLNIILSTINPVEVIEAGFWSMAAAFSLRTVYEQYGREKIDSL